MSNKENKDKSHVFYGISLPINAFEDNNQRNDIKLVFNERLEALEVIKKFKGSRFKAFDTIDDAIVFSQEVIKPEISLDVNKDNKNIEKSLSPFNGLHPRELTKLRKAIETDDYQTVDQLIWSNPRYLVSSGDTPVVLMEGPRYNACHIAAKAGKHSVLKLILKTVSDKQFMKLLFPFDTNLITESRIKYLLDLYLNTPEKGFNETPLHFGCKFGSTETVSVLLGFPECDVKKVNKLGKKASEVVCERKGDNSVKTQILKLFENNVYIPLLRDDISAGVGKPFQGFLDDRRLSGLAGPMSPIQATELYQKLRSPAKCTQSERNIRLTDSRKGLERIARNVCKRLQINWSEFWSFLNTRIDLTSEEGLNCLEKHLRQIYYNLDSSFGSESNSFFKSENITDFENSLNTLSKHISKLNINSDIDLEFTKNTETDSNCKEIEPNLQLSEIGDQLNVCDSDSDDSFVSASSTPTYLYDFYIHGAKISKEDIDAALALQHIIDSDLCLNYQFIQNWFQRVVREEPKHFDSLSNHFSPLSSTPVKCKQV